MRFTLKRRDSCHEVAKVLQSYLDAETSPERTKMVAEHLEECRRCGLEAETYRSIKVAIAASNPSAPEAQQAIERLRVFADHLVNSADE